MGGSLFLLSPVFFAALWNFRKGDQRLSDLFLAVTVILVYLPISLLLGTGFVNFGMRYSLDFIVPLMLLTAKGLERWPEWVIGVLTFISCVDMLIGAVLMKSV